MSIFALAVITQNIKVYICLNGNKNVDVGRRNYAYAWLITGLGYLKNYVISFWIAILESTIIPLKFKAYPKFLSQKTWP